MSDEKQLEAESSAEHGTKVHEAGNPLKIEVGDFYLGKLIGLMLTVVDATVPVDNRPAAKSLTKQIIRTWFNDCSEHGRYYDLGSMGEAEK
jgi:hypothetical protein